jgi:hypothetical protein
LENVDIFYGHLDYFTDIWDILGPFCVHLVHFSSFGVLRQEKSGNPVQQCKYTVWQPCWQLGQ